MDLSFILSKCDHTLLSQKATWEDIRTLCDEGIAFATASVCIPPYFVKQAKEYVGDRLKICTVIGFPNGYNTTAVKCFETRQAVRQGADEIDMVINVGAVKAGRYDEVLREIRCVKNACSGRLLKVIIETCLLSVDEKIELCRVVSESGAEFIKTSTGFSTGGATFEDVALLRKFCAPEVKVKASGGISSVEDAERFLELGADRLGTSRIVRIAKQMTAADHAQ